MHVSPSQLLSAKTSASIKMKLVHFALFIAAAAARTKKKAPPMKFISTPNRLAELGGPELVKKLHGASPPNMDWPDSETYKNFYPMWMTPHCDQDHPHPAVDGRPWNEIQFESIGQCVNIQKWKPYVDAGFTFRVNDFSMLQSEDEGPCRLHLYQSWNCLPDGRHPEPFQARVSFRVFQLDYLASMSCHVMSCPCHVLPVIC